LVYKIDKTTLYQTSDVHHQQLDVHCTRFKIDKMCTSSCIKFYSYRCTSQSVLSLSWREVGSKALVNYPSESYD